MSGRDRALCRENYERILFSGQTGDLSAAASHECTKVFWNANFRYTLKRLHVFSPGLRASIYFIVVIYVNLTVAHKINLFREDIF